MLASLKQKSMLSQFWGQISEIPVWQGGAVSRGPRGESFLPLPAAGGSSVPGLLAAAPVSASAFTCSPPWVCVSPKDPCH